MSDEIKLGQNKYTYKNLVSWAKPPEGIGWHEVAGVAFGQRWLSRGTHWPGHFYVKPCGRPPINVLRSPPAVLGAHAAHCAAGQGARELGANR